MDRNTENLDTLKIDRLLKTTYSNCSLDINCKDIGETTITNNTTGVKVHIMEFARENNLFINPCIDPTNVYALVGYITRFIVKEHVYRTQIELRLADNCPGYFVKVPRGNL